MTPELARPVLADGIPPEGRTIKVTASAEECAALARRLQIPAVTALSCRFHLVPGFGGVIDATGTLRAGVVQTCIASLEDFPATVDETFTVRFVPAGQETDDDDPESVDEIPFDGGRIDLGEAAAEQLALALDPYPRRPGLAAPDAGAAASTSPFAALAALKIPRRPT